MANSEREDTMDFFHSSMTFQNTFIYLFIYLNLKTWSHSVAQAGLEIPMHTYSSVQDVSVST